MRRAGGDDLSRWAIQLTRRKARSFYLASLFLPPPVRRDVHLIYAYYRTVDDLVDEPLEGTTPEQIRDQLQSWEDQLTDAVPTTWALLVRIRELAEKHAIPVEYLTMVLRGASFDLEMHSIETLHELIEYSVLVAGSVGMVMSCVLGARSPQALAAACDLGVAMQLTNVLRDVREDRVRGRVYLPRAEMRASGCSAEMLASGAVTPQFCAVVRRLSDEARNRYRSGTAGIQYLDPSVQFAILLAANLYRRILDKIEHQQFDVFAQRVHLGPMEKWAYVMPLLVQHRLSFRK